MGCIATRLYAWRREFRSAAFADARIPALDFVPVMAQSRVGSGSAMIEIEVGGAVVRAGAGVDLAFLGKIIRVLKATP